MKKLVLILAVTIGMAACGYAQPNDVLYQQATYTRVGYLNPVGSFSDSYSKGINIEVGRLFSLNVPLPENMGLGIDWSFGELSFQTMKERSFLTDSTTGGILFNLGTKIGAVFSFNPTDLLIFDVYLKYYPGFTLARKGMIDRRTGASLEKTPGWAGAFSNSLSTGMNIRYTYFSVGVEFCFGGATLNYSNDVVPVIQNVGGADVVTGYVSKNEDFETASFRLNVGFWF